ncbi:LamG-like jellyroll fold domain-containing protein [Allorhodopirellula solitaria]|uniref:Neutral/alkaline non-lysosomal ceramidase n=1 Tax=Allorhodopirellula solitaria TaxID=2527987 RepID=A0A5C5YBZ3_9BACT|nr:LamG-like jellyroll fold domain-containing protein [Allorhodopirellula solitaria]TWT73226.1 Neutral/alkaline non-lysosomal ceramidase [Allorhodopirellula solitaria]
MKSVSIVVLLCILQIHFATRTSAEFRAGAAVVDASPDRYPVLVNGGMTSRSADRVVTPISARAIVFDDGEQRIGIVVVDSCMMPRPLLDEAKAFAAEQTELRPDRILISATHTHTAPASMGCLGTDADANYLPVLREQIVAALVAAENNLEPARVGWGVGDAAAYTALRRWIRRPDRVVEDPFGNPTVRASMHAGANWDDVTGESGPEDPDLSLISVQAKDGRPIAVLANFSMHYFGAADALNADYFGLFCNGLQSRIETAPDEDRPPFVAIMSHGCSGDIWRRDYTEPADSRPEPTIESYAADLTDIAMATYEAIDYQEPEDLAMAETRFELKYRVPTKQRLEWAQRIVDEMGDRLPKTRPEIYAREQVFLHQWQSTEVVVQALRIGDIGIASTPTETYALTGLKLKLQSPLSKTMVIELANGGDGYIPPPEQHLLGGYNTWAARSAGLEVEAEPKIAAAALGLLEDVAGRSRRVFQQSRGPASQELLNARPAAYWRMDEMAGPRAVDSSGQHRDAIYERGVVYFLAGPRSDAFSKAEGEANRAAHFAGERLRARVAGLSDEYTISLWCWNGMPVDGRRVAGWMFSRGHDHDLGPGGDHLGLGGAEHHPGRLIFLHGDEGQGAKVAAGSTPLRRWNWNHVVLVRDREHVRVHLNGNPQPEIEVQSPGGFPAGLDRLFFGGRCDNESNWEGRLDEIAVFDRALTPDEITALYPAED